MLLGQHSLTSTRGTPTMQKITRSKKSVSAWATEKQVEKIAALIADSFSWADSPQGFNYWAEVNKNLHSIILIEWREKIKKGVTN